MDFRERNDAELAAFSDEEIVRYIGNARAEQRIDAAVTAAQILAFRYERAIRGFVYTQLGSKGPLAVEEVAERVIADGVASASRFQGETVPEFRAWLFRIAKNRIADYHRKGRIDAIPLEIPTPEGAWREREIETGDPTEVIDRGDVINQALRELSDLHRHVVILVRFRNCSHREAAEEVNRHFAGQLDDLMTEQNVSQINSRFGKRLDGLLGQADDPEPPRDDD